MALYRFRATGTEDGHLESAAGTWADAQAGSGALTVTTSGNQVNVRTAATSIIQGFGTWDTSSIGDSEACAWCAVKVSPPTTWSNTAHLRVGRHDWGASLDASAWRTVAQLQALDLLADADMNGLESPAGLVQTLLWGAQSPDAINKVGNTQFVAWLKQAEDASSPGDLQADTNGADAATAFNRTELIVATDGGASPYPVATGRPVAVNTSAISVAVPDIPDGHMGVIAVYGRGEKSNDFTTPSGWTLERTEVTDGTHGRLSVFTRKNTTGSTIAAESVSISYATSDAIIGQACVLARCASVGAISVETGNNGTTHTIPSVSTTAAHSLVITFIGGNDDPAFQYENETRFPLFMGAPLSTTLSFDASMAALMVEQPTQGATGTDALTTSAAYRSVAISVEFVTDSPPGPRVTDSTAFFSAAATTHDVDLSGLTINAGDLIVVSLEADAFPVRNPTRTLNGEWVASAPTFSSNTASWECWLKVADGTETVFPYDFQSDARFVYGAILVVSNWYGALDGVQVFRNGSGNPSDNDWPWGRDDTLSIVTYLRHAGTSPAITGVPNGYAEVVNAAYPEGAVSATYQEMVDSGGIDPDVFATTGTDSARISFHIAVRSSAEAASPPGPVMKAVGVASDPTGVFSIDPFTDLTTVAGEDPPAVGDYAIATLLWRSNSKADPTIPGWVLVRRAVTTSGSGFASYVYHRRLDGTADDAITHNAAFSQCAIIMALYRDTDGIDDQAVAQQSASWTSLATAGGSVSNTLQVRRSIPGELVLAHGGNSSDTDMIGGNGLVPRAVAFNHRQSNSSGGIVEYVGDRVGTTGQYTHYLNGFRGGSHVGVLSSLLSEGSVGAADAYRVATVVLESPSSANVSTIPIDLTGTGVQAGDVMIFTLVESNITRALTPPTVGESEQLEALVSGGGLPSMQVWRHVVHADEVVANQVVFTLTAGVTWMWRTASAAFYRGVTVRSSGIVNPGYRLDYQTPTLQNIDGERWLRLHALPLTGVQTPNNAAFQLTGPIEVEVDAQLDQWSGASSHQWLISSLLSNAGFGLRVSSTAGSLAFFFGNGASDTNRSYTPSPPLVDGQRYKIRVQFTPDDGGGLYRMKFFVDDVEMTEFTGAASTLAAATGPMSVGGTAAPSPGDTVRGRIYSATLRDGWGGPVVLDFDPSLAYDGATPGDTFTGPEGLVWTLMGNDGLALIESDPGVSGLIALGILWGPNNAGGRWDLIRPVDASIISSFEDSSRLGHMVDFVWNHPTDVGPLWARANTGIQQGTAALVLLEPVAASTTPVSKDLGLVWSAGFQVGDEVASVWHVSGLVSETGEAVWNLRALVLGDVEAQWSALALVADSLAVAWDSEPATGSVVGDEAQPLWAVSGITSDQSSLPWGVLASVSDQVANEWSQNGTVGEPMDARWDVRLSAVDAAQFDWQTGIQVLDDIQALWGVAGLVGGQRGLLWSLLGLVGAQDGFTWNISGLVGDEIESPWTVAGGATNQVAAPWDVAGIVGDGVESRWAALGEVGDELGSVWSVRGAVAGEAFALWGVGGLAGDDSVVRWAVAGFVGGSADLGWQVALVATDATALSWAASGAVASGDQLGWSVEAQVGGVLQALWQASGLVIDSLDVEWTVGVVYGLGLAMPSSARQYPGAIRSIEGGAVSSAVEGYPI